MLKTFICSLVFTAALSTSALSATFLATAQNADVSDFSIGFDDQNANGLLELGEVTDFSGVTITNLLGSTFVFTDLVSVAQIDGFTLDGSDKWLFSNSTVGNYDHAAWNWSYEISTVPLPGSLFALIAGLVGLAGLRARTSKPERLLDRAVPA